MGIELKVLISNEGLMVAKLKEILRFSCLKCPIEINQLLKSGFLITLLCKIQSNFDWQANQIFGLIFTHWCSENN